jgi:hypothetical protein
MEHCHILRFLLVGGLVVEDQRYGLREGTLIYFLWVRAKEVTDQQVRRVGTKKFSKMLPRCLLIC